MNKMNSENDLLLVNTSTFRVIISEEFVTRHTEMIDPPVRENHRVCLGMTVDRTIIFGRRKTFYKAPPIVMGLLNLYVSFSSLCYHDFSQFGKHFENMISWVNREGPQLLLAKVKNASGRIGILVI